MWLSSRPLREDSGCTNHQPIPPATEAVLSQLTRAENEEALKACCEEYKAALFIRIANDKKYGTVKKKIYNMFLFDQEAYPKSLEKAYTYLLNFQSESAGGMPRGNLHGHEGVSLAEVGGEGRRIGPCFNCGEYGHLAASCEKLSDEDKKAVKNAGKQGQAHVNVGGDVEAANRELQECIDGVANIHVGMDDASIGSLDDEYGFINGVSLYVSTAAERGRVDCGRNKLFLDSCATQHTMFGVEYLERVHLTDTYLRQNCNAGSKLTNKCGYYA